MRGSAGQLLRTVVVALGWLDSVVLSIAMEWATTYEHIYKDLGNIRPSTERNTSVLIISFSLVYAICGPR